MLSFKYWKFDLENATSQDYDALSQAFEDVGYSYAEESGKISKIKKSTRDAEIDLESVCLRTDDFFPEKVQKLSLSDALHFADAFDITEKFCKDGNPRPIKTGLNEYRCITFDLTREDYSDPKKRKSRKRYSASKYKKVVGFANAIRTEPGKENWSDDRCEQYARNQLVKSLEKHGFVRSQNSMFVSKEKMTDDKLKVAFKEICKENKLLYKYALEVHLSVRGRNTDKDMVNFAKNYVPSVEVQYKLKHIRDDLFLTLNVEKNRAYCYAYDKEHNKFYKYQLSDNAFGLGEKAFSSIKSLSVDIMNGHFDKFRSSDSVKEVTVEDFEKATERSNIAFDKILNEDKTYDLAFTRENLSKLVLALKEPEKSIREEKNKKAKELQNALEKEFDISYIETPTIKKFHVSNIERGEFFDAIAKASNVEVLDKTKRRTGAILEKNQDYDNITIPYNIVAPSDCNALKYYDKDSIVSGKLWSEVYNREQKLNSKPDALVASVIELDIPKELNFMQAQKALEKFSKDVFAKNGHISQCFLQCEKDNPTKLKGTVVVANRRMEKNKWVEKKGIEVVVDGEKKNISLLYGVDSRDAGQRVRNAWLETINDVLNEKNNTKIKILYNSKNYLAEFYAFIEKEKEALGKQFDKRKVSVKKQLKTAWRERMEKHNRVLRNPDLEM